MIPPRLPVSKLCQWNAPIVRQERARLTKPDMHCNARRSLNGASDVVAIPCHTLRHVGVYTATEEEATSIFDVRILRRDEHDEPKEGRDAEADHEDSSSL